VSTVAYRNGVMAADTLSVSGSSTHRAQKLFRCSRDLVVGFTGNFMDGLEFVRWCEAGMDLTSTPEWRNYRGAEDAPDFTAIVLTSDGLSEWTEHFLPHPITDEFYAIGSGKMCALAAMYMGAGAEEAVTVASAIDVNTGGDVQVEHLGVRKVA